MQGDSGLKSPFKCWPACALVWVLTASLCLSQSAELPRVHLIATGGTIAGGPSGSLQAEDLAKLIPELNEIAVLTAEDFTNISSYRMTSEIQFRLAKRINEIMESQSDVAGIVITHGTDSLEETAFFLDLLVSSERPVVFAAAMRPPRMTDSDGPRNLLNAIRIAASEASRGMGVVVTLNDEIHAAREVRKAHSIALDAFVSLSVGPLGYVDGGRIYFIRKPIRRFHLSVDSVEQHVDLITLVAGSDGHLVRAAADSGAKGIVLEVFGRGNAPPAVMEAVKEVREKGVVVVFTTRTRGGRMVLSRSARQLGVVGGEDLDGLKARILLVVSLGETKDLNTLQSYFQRLSGEVGRE